MAHDLTTPIETGQAVYFWRRVTDAARKPAMYFWHGPARVGAISATAYSLALLQPPLHKAAPEKLRPALEEEFFSLSGWLEGISNANRQFEAEKIKGLINLSKEPEGPAPAIRQFLDSSSCGTPQRILPAHEL